MKCAAWLVKDGTVVELGMAESGWARLRGLLGRRGLRADEGLWIRPCSGVHTMFMRFAIDVVGLDDEQRVVRLWHGVPPWRMTGVSWKVKSVLELPAGCAQKLRLCVGERVAVN